MAEETEKSPEELIESMEAAQEPFKAPEVTMSSSSGKSSGGTVAIVAIIATAVLMLGCIIACAAIAYAFILNAPW